MEDLTKEILNSIGNNHTKVQEKEDFNGNYYSFINDTIYIGKNFEVKKKNKKMEQLNQDAARLITVCHECVHSLQKKWIHILNIILSNASILLFISYFVCMFFKSRSMVLAIVTLFAIVFSLVIRMILEFDAISGSINESKKLVEFKKVSNVSIEDIDKAQAYMNKYKILAVLSMIYSKLLIALIVIISIII